MTPESPTPGERAPAKREPATTPDAGSDAGPGSPLDAAVAERQGHDHPHAAQHRSHRAPPPVHTDRRHRGVGWQSRDVLRASAIAICMYFALRFVWFANPLFLTVFLGILFGLAVSAGVDRLEQMRIPRGIGAALIVLSAIGALVGFGAWVAPTLREQGTELRRKLPEAIDRVEHWVSAHRGGVVDLILGGLATEARVDSASTVPAAPTPAPVGVARSPSPDSTRPATARDSAARVSGLDSQIIGAARPDSAGAGAKPAQAALRDRLGKRFSGATRYLFPFLSSTLEAFAGALLIIFLAIYIAADPDLYRRGLIALSPRRHRERMGEVLSAIATVLRKWLVTQLIAMVTIGVVTTVVLMVLRVKAAVALGVIAGLLEFVPTIGPIMSAVPAVAMGFLDSPEKALTVAAAYFGIQFIENHLLIPLLMKGGMDLPPAMTILSQALMAMLFGFLGLMCAVPLLAAGMVSVKMLYVEGVVGDDPSGPDEEPPEGVE
jgi:predicted PurR-regulated permease PerM